VPEAPEGVNPDDRRYSDQHQWIKVHVDGAYRIGVTWWEHQRLVAPIHVEMPDVGEHLDAGEMYGMVECMLGAIGELRAPVAGRVVAVNEEFVADPEMLYVYDEPYESWLIAVVPDDVGDLDRLLDAGGYTERTKYAREWGFGGVE